MAHTPGPWICERDPNREEFYITSASREGKVPIAAVEFGFEGEIEREQQANGPLIAAAPNMLTVMREMAEYMGEPVQMTPGNIQAAVVNALIRNIRAAIAKAEGT